MPYLVQEDFAEASTEWVSPSLEEALKHMPVEPPTNGLRRVRILDRRVGTYEAWGALYKLPGGSLWSGYRPDSGGFDLFGGF